MADGIQTNSEVTFGVETYARVVVILVSAAQAVFYYVQRQKKQCGWEKLYTAVAETITYIIVTSLGSAGVVTVAGRPWLWPRYAGWLSTCPVLLIDVSMIPMPAAREPGQAMTSILAFQLVVLLGQTSIFFSDPGTRLALFIAAVVCGLYVFKLVFDTFVRAWRSFPDNEPAMRNGLIMAALTFFSGWVAFPVLFSVGAEGFGSLGAAGSALAHALADLVAKNAYSYASWHLRWVVIREYLDRRAAEAADLEARKNRAIKDAEAGIAAGEEGSRAGIPLGLPGTSAIVAALAAEERELQRPIDVADVIDASGEVTGPCGEELFAALRQVAALTAPAILSGVLPAAMAREERLRLNVVVVDHSASRQAAAAGHIRDTESARGMGVDVRFAFRPGDVGRVRAAHGGSLVHAVVITDDALFHACERPELDEGARVANVIERHRQGAVAPFAAPAAPAAATLGTMLGAERVYSDIDLSDTSHRTDGSGSTIGPSAMSGASDGSPRSADGPDSITPADGVVAGGFASRGMGGRLNSALAIQLADEPHIAVGPLAAVEALRQMATGGVGRTVVIVVSTGAASERPRRGQRSGGAGGGSHGVASRVSLYDVGADVVVAAMGRARDWTDGMERAADVAFDTLESGSEASGGGHVDLTDDRDSERGRLDAGRRRGGKAPGQVRSGRDRRGGRRGSSASDASQSDGRDGDTRRRLRPGQGPSSSTESDDGDLSTSASHGGDGMPELHEDATGAKRLLAEGVRAALDAATRAVLPQGLARLVSGVARSADAVVDERVGQRRSADERRAAEGLAMAAPAGVMGGGMATYTMLDAGVMAIPRDELRSIGSGGASSRHLSAGGGGASPGPADALVRSSRGQGRPDPSPLRREDRSSRGGSSRRRRDSESDEEETESPSRIDIPRRGSVGNMAAAVTDAFRG